MISENEFKRIHSLTNPEADDALSRNDGKKDSFVSKGRKNRRRRISLCEIENNLKRLEELIDNGAHLDVCLPMVADSWRSLRRRRDSGAEDLRAFLVVVVHKIYTKYVIPMSLLRRECELTYPFLSRRFKELSLPARNSSERTAYAGPPHCDYHVNHSALDHVWKEKTAYVLGFIWADGRVLGQNKRKPEGVGITVSPKDISVLYFMLDFFGSDAPIKDVTTKIKGKKHPGKAIFIYSRKLAQKLADLGYMNRQAGKNNTPLPEIPSSVLVDFWRGVCDGDGHIRRDPRCRFPLSGWEVGISGTAALVDAFREFVSEKLNIPVAVCYNGESRVCYRVHVSGVRAPILAAMLYSEGCCRAMDRKYDRARALSKARQMALQHGVREVHHRSRLLYVNRRTAAPLLPDPNT